MRSVSTGGRRLSHAALASRELALTPERTVTRKELAAAAREGMEALDLRPTLRLVLAELVGCWGEEAIEDHMIVWPSNDYLVRRTGLSERAVRHGIRGLIEAGLIAAKDSANGKRFCRRDAAGILIDAFGFDVTPVYFRRGEFVVLVLERKKEREMAKRLFDEITINRRASEEALAALAVHYPAVERGELDRRLVDLRGRTPARWCMADLERLKCLVEGWRALREVAETTFQQAGYAGTSDRHKEQDNESSASDSCQTRQASDVEPGPLPGVPALSLILEACPSTAWYYGLPIGTFGELVRACGFLRATIGAHQSAWDEAVELIGATRAAVVVAWVLQLHEDDQASETCRIKNPGGYFRALVRRVNDRAINLETEMLTLRRRHLC